VHSGWSRELASVLLRDPRDGPRRRDPRRPPPGGRGFDEESAAFLSMPFDAARSAPGALPVEARCCSEGGGGCGLEALIEPAFDSSFSNLPSS